MLASEMVAELSRLIEQHGDGEVWQYAYGCGGHYNCEPFDKVDEVIFCDGKLRIESV